MLARTEAEKKLIMRNLVGGITRYSAYIPSDTYNYKPQDDHFFNLLLAEFISAPLSVKEKIECLQQSYLNKSFRVEALQPFFSSLPQLCQNIEELIEFVLPAFLAMPQPEDDWKDRYLKGGFIKSIAAYFFNPYSNIDAVSFSRLVTFTHNDQNMLHYFINMSYYTNDLVKKDFVALLGRFLPEFKKFKYVDYIQLLGVGSLNWKPEYLVVLLQGLKKSAGLAATIEKLFTKLQRESWQSIEPVTDEALLNYVKILVALHANGMDKKTIHPILMGAEGSGETFTQFALRTCPDVFGEVMHLLTGLLPHERYTKEMGRKVLDYIVSLPSEKQTELLLGIKISAENPLSAFFWEPKVPFSKAAVSPIWAKEIDRAHEASVKAMPERNNSKMSTEAVMTSLLDGSEGSILRDIPSKKSSKEIVLPPVKFRRQDNSITSTALDKDESEAFIAITKRK